MFGMVPYRRNNRGLSKKEDYFDQLFNNFFNEDEAFPAFDMFGSGSFRVDMKETDNAYMMEADLPGVPKEGINIEYNNSYLTISAKRDNQVEEKNNDYIRRERSCGEYKRSFYVDNIDENKIDASYKDGVLKVILPKVNKGRDKKENRNKITIFTHILTRYENEFTAGFYISGKKQKHLFSNNFKNDAICSTVIREE